MRNRRLWVLGIVLMAALLFWGRHDLGKIGSLHLLPLVVCFLCTAGIALSSALKWRVCLHSMGEARATHFGSLLHYFMIGRVLGLVVPMDFGDFAARTMSLKFDHAMPIGKASYSVYLDRTFDVVVAAFLFVPSLLFILGVIQPGLGLVLYGLAFAAGYLCFVLWGRQSMDFVVLIFHFLFKAVCRIPGIRSRVDADAESKFLVASSFPSVTPKLYLLSGMKFLCTSFRFASIALAMGMIGRTADMLLFAPGAQAAAVFAVTPGGIGIVDWLWSLILMKIRVDQADVVPYLVSLRLATWFSVLVLAGLSRSLYRRPPAPVHAGSGGPQAAETGTEPMPESGIAPER